MQCFIASSNVIIFVNFVATVGLEPTTYGLSVRCSNHLSYVTDDDWPEFRHQNIKPIPNEQARLFVFQE